MFWWRIRRRCDGVTNAGCHPDPAFVNPHQNCNHQTQPYFLAPPPKGSFFSVLSTSTTCALPTQTLSYPPLQNPAMSPPCRHPHRAYDSDIYNAGALHSGYACFCSPCCHLDSRKDISFAITALFLSVIVVVTKEQFVACLAAVGTASQVSITTPVLGL